MEGEVERPSYDVAAAAAAPGVADMLTAALDTEGSRILVAFAPGLERTCAHVAHGFVMTRPMLANSTVAYDILVAGKVFAAYGQPPLYRVLLVHLISLSGLHAREHESLWISKAEITYLRKKIALTRACRRGLVRNTPLEERGRWRQGLAESMETGDGAVDRDSKDVEKGRS